VHLGSTGVDDGRLELVLNLPRAGAGLLKLGDDHHTLIIGNLTEDNVLSIQPRGDDGGDEELGSVGVGASIGHGQETGLGMLSLEVLVRELLAIDGLAAGAIASSEVTTLQHELRDDSVELATLVAKALLTSAEGTEVLGGLWDYIVVEFEVDSAGLRRRDSSARACSISSGFVKSSVGPFDVEPSVDGHFCGGRRKMSSSPRSRLKLMRTKRLTKKRGC